MPELHHNNREPRRAAPREHSKNAPPPRRAGTARPLAGAAKPPVPGNQQQARQRPGAKPPQGRGRRVKYRWFRAIIMVISAVVGSCFLAIFVLQSASDLFGLNQPDNSLEVTIPQNADLARAASILANTGIVDQEISFRLYAEFKFKEGESVQPGDYVFNSNMGYDEIILLLKNGIQEDKIVRLTFPEGLTLGDIAQMLEDEGVCKKKDFIDYLETAEFNYDFFNQIPDDESRFRKLEGYLYPDTYEFYMPERVGSVAKKFFDNFNSKISDDMLRRMQNLNMTLDETITLASVIQKEADRAEHMRRVSSVFHNRLDLPGVYPSLQSDVTIFYVETEIKPYMSEQDQAMYDAYNTYVRQGLPVGPVCSPGMEAITAALYPAETDYYFFVTDVNMEFYYAETMQKHNENIRLAASADESGRGVVHGIDTQ